MSSLLENADVGKARRTEGIAAESVYCGVPGLVGLRPSYIAAQLTRWRVGERRAADPDCMHRIATRLTESDIAAVAAYISQQDPPRDPSPESANFVRMPMACGTQR